LNIVRPLMVGGATSMYCGCSAHPPAWLRTRYDIDLQPYADETVTELGIAPLPPELRGEASTRVAHAAGELGMEFQPQDKFMTPARAKHFDCSSKCMLGCRCGAKWSAAEYVDQAVAAGAQLWTRTTVDKLLIDDGRVEAVAGRRRGKPFRVETENVIVAAGGIGSPVLLRNSGISDAGRGMTMDITVMVYGHAQGKGMGGDPPMTWSYADDELGVLYSTLIDPWLMYPIIMTRKGPSYPLTWHRWGRTYGVMIKLKDEISGEVDARGKIMKGLTSNDRVRLSPAEGTARNILIRAGCKPDSIFSTPLRGTHPSGTVRIGELVGNNLQTGIGGLYVCDASVFPEALARPTVLTIISFAKRLAKHLLAPSELP
jgi:choline dehydrogenase-like flavoprotein